QPRLHVDNRDHWLVPAVSGVCRRSRHPGRDRGEDGIVGLGWVTGARVASPGTGRGRAFVQADRAPAHGGDRPGTELRRQGAPDRLLGHLDGRGARDRRDQPRLHEGTAAGQGSLEDLPGSLQGRAVHAAGQGERRRPPLPGTEDPERDQLRRCRLRARSALEPGGRDRSDGQPDEGCGRSGSPGIQHPNGVRRDHRDRLPGPPPDL
ncbi:MAG: N-acetyl-gamma-aminoadipyl-phosphate reductase, partial [uncultured Thermomicrobiales bacterium]